MPENKTAGIEEALDIAADVDADDDDIVDLLEVVKPGALSLQGGFPDPTPVDHIVDYNESLELPGMDDLDAFLSSLGVPKTDSPAPSGGALPASDPGLEALDAVPAVDAPPSGSQEFVEEDFLDSLLEEGKNSEADTQTAMGSLTPEELDLLQEVPDAPADQEPECDEDAFLDTALTEALDVAVVVEDDEDTSAHDAHFDAVRDAALEALLKAGDVAVDQSPSTPGSPEESFDAEPAAALGEEAPDPLVGKDDDNAPAPEDFLDTAAGDIASESLDMAAFDAEEKDPPEETATRSTEVTEDRAEPRGSLFPEPVLEDAPPPGAAPAAAATVPPVSASRFDEVDLNELDALLDTMLASAPAPDPPPATDPGEAVPVVADAPAPTGESPAAESGGVIATLESDLAALRLDVENLREALAVLPDQAARLATIEERLSGLEKSETDAEAPADPGFADSLQRMEERILTLENRLEEALARDAQASLDALDARISGLAAGFAGIEQRFADFSANIDKVAAKAAATVLREEIAALAAQDD